MSKTRHETSGSPKLQGMHRILVTGHTGFVGKHLMNVGATEAMVDDQGRIELNDTGRIEWFLKSNEFDAVIHLAAQSNVPASIADPKATMYSNVLGTINLLSCLEKTSFSGRFLFISSGDVYGK